MFVTDFDVSSPAGHILVRKVIDGVCSSILDNGGLELLDRLKAGAPETTSKRI